MERTLPREQFIQLMREWGQAGSAELVEAVIAELGMSAKQAFTKADVSAVMAGITAYARAQLEQPEAYGGADAAARSHMRGMLDALDAHALPLIKRS